ncbi:hypothetical protein AB1Y20_019053 [Prymnesium parvum]|uniref:Uncharacterized protein n=1 Tax=Prymnesium parvum TaxID=97485 RepID=A0AB34JPY7_PRYPA
MSCLPQAISQKPPAASGSDAQPPKPLAVGELLFAPPRARGSPALGDFELGLVLFVEPSNIDCHILWMTQGDRAVMMRKAAPRSVLRSIAQEKWWRLGHATLGTPARLESFSEDELGCFSREDAEELVRAAAPHLPENAPLKRQRQARSFGDTVVQKVERPAKQKKLAAVAASSAAMAPGGADVSAGQRDFALHEHSGRVSPPQSNAVVVANTPAERAASMAHSSAEKDAHRVPIEGVSPTAGREEAAAVRRTPAESAASKADSSAEKDAHRVATEGVSPTAGREEAAAVADSSAEKDAHRVPIEGVSPTVGGAAHRKKAAAVRRTPAESAASKADSSDEENAHRVATEGVSATERGSSPRKKAAAVRRTPAESAASKADSSDEEDAHRVRTEGAPSTERGSPPSNNQTAPAEGAAADADSSDDVIGEEPSHIRLSDEEWLPEDKRKVTLAKASDEERHHGSSKASQSPGKPRSVIPVVAPAAAATSPTAGLHASAATGEKPRKRKAPHELPRGDAPRLAAAPAPSAASASAPTDAASPHRVNKQTFVQILRQEHFDDAEQARRRRHMPKGGGGACRPVHRRVLWQVQQWVKIMRRCTEPAEQTSLLKPFLKKFDTATYKSLVGASGGLELLKRWLELAIDQSPQAGSSVQLIKDVLELVTRLPLSFDRLKQTDLGPLLPKLEAHGDEEVVRLALAVKRAILKVAHAEIRLDLPVAGDPAPFAFIEGASGEHATTAASPRVPPASQPIGKKASKPVRQKPSELVDWIIAKAPQLPAIHRPSVATSIPTASPVAPASHATALVEEAAAWPTAALSLEPTVVFTEDDPSLADEVWRKLRAPVRIIRELTTEYLRARPQLLVLIDRGKIPRICEYKDWNWLELKHNPRAVIVDKFYILRCLEEGKFLPLLKEEQYFPSGGIVLVDALTCNANEQMVQSVACELRRLSDARSIWQVAYRK